MKKLRWLTLILLGISGFSAVQSSSTKEIQEINGYLKQKQLLLENKIDLLIGGSPCQDLSISKRNRQKKDFASSPQIIKE